MTLNKYPEFHSNRNNRNILLLIACLVFPITAYAGFFDRLKESVSDVESFTEGVSELAKKGIDAIQTSEEDTQADEKQSTPESKETVTVKNKSKNTKEKKSLKNLGFHPGEVIHLESAAPKRIKGLTLPAFRGKLRLGFQDNYFLNDNYQKNKPEVYETLAERRKLITEKDRSVRVLMKLLAIKAAKSSLNRDTLKDNFYSGHLKQKKTTQQGSLSEQQWYPTLRYVASQSLTPKRFAKYFCSDKKCSATELRPSISIIDIGSWGGGKFDQFKKRRAFHNFIDKELDHYFNWTDTIDLTSEVYMVGLSYLSDYQFDLNGYVVNINIGSSRHIENSKVKSLPIFTGKRQGKTQGILIKVDEDEAEKWQERRQYKSLYTVYKAELNISKSAYFHGTSDLNVNNVVFEQVLTSAVIEGYLDEALTDKLFEVPVNDN